MWRKNKALQLLTTFLTMVSFYFDVTNNKEDVI